MSTQRQVRTPAGPLRNLLLLLFVMTGLFLMHGLQASADPTQHTGVPVMTGMLGMGAAHADAAHPRVHDWSSHGSPGHDHAGGQMCLALLSMTALLLLSAMLGRLPRRLARGVTVARRFAHEGRSPPPPSIFQLSVLRT